MRDTFIGKRFHVWGDGPPTSEGDLRARLSGLNLRDSLRALGHAYNALDTSSGRFTHVQDVPVPRHALAYIALLLILESSDAGSGVFDDERLAAVLRDYHNLAEVSLDDDLVFEYLIRLGQSQFSLQHDDGYAVPRTYLVFGQVWNQRARGQLPDDIVLESTGLELEHLLLFGQAFTGMAKQGYVNPYGYDPASEHPTLRLFSRDRQLLFLERLSATYETIRRAASDSEPANPALRKYRSNPLFMYPLVKPDLPPPADPPVYVTPCPSMILMRVTDALPFDCYKRFGNAFDDQFGFVVEDHVGKILRECCKTGVVRGEFSYSVDGRTYKSPDWIILDNGRAVVIEVKKSLLRSKAKAFGDSSSVRRDLKETLFHAKSQLQRFRSHLHHIDGMPSAENVELAAVFWDGTSWVNSILQQEFSAGTSDETVHAMSVKELERLLARESFASIYDLLWSKRWASDESRLMDLWDWMAHQSLSSGVENRFLASIRSQLWEKWGLDEP